MHLELIQVCATEVPVCVYYSQIHVFIVSMLLLRT